MQVFVSVKNVIFFLSKKTLVNMINNNVTLDVTKTTENCLFILKTFFTVSLYVFSLFKAFLFFVFVKLALGLNNVCKVRCTNKQKRKRPFFLSLPKITLKTSYCLQFCILFFFSSTLFMCYLDF